MSNPLLWFNLSTFSVAAFLCTTFLCVAAPSSWENPKDGSVLVTVPAGDFFYGAAPDDSKAGADKKPGRRITLPAFQIAKNEVTNAQYERFVQASGRRGSRDALRKNYAAEWGERAPVVHVDWNDAQAYCDWAGLRLPTEQEWERAARGTDGRIYPWGNHWEASRAVFNAKRAGPVGSLPSGLSPAGCFDMAGNVWEWTSSKYNNTQEYVHRGGGWDDADPACLLASFRGSSAPYSGGYDLGFRCARTP